MAHNTIHFLSKGLPVLLLAFNIACNNSQAGTNVTATLHIGEGINFTTGKVSRMAADIDMGFKYLPPQSPHGWRYNPATGNIEYQAQVQSNQNYPLLTAKKTGSFKTKPDIQKFTSGDINNWTEDEFDIGPGRYLVVRALTTGKHYLVTITKLTTPSNDTKTWQISFTYEPIPIAVGAAGTAGKTTTMPGSLTYKEFIHSEKIITLDLTTGDVTELFDGYGVSRNRKGEFAWFDNAGHIIISGKNKEQLAQLTSPATEPKTNPKGGEVVIAPDGNYLAVQVERRRNYTSGGITVPGIPEPFIIVINRQGKEVAAFPACRGSAWFSDGRLAMASMDVDKPGIVIADATFKNVRMVPNVSSVPTITDVAPSPDGKRIAFSGNDRVWLINTDGSNLKQLTTSGLSEVTPVWSPDGSLIAFQQSYQGATGKSYQIVVIDPQTQKLTYVRDREGMTREPYGRMWWY